MPTITKSRAKVKSQSAAPVTALASRDRVDVPTAKRRARRRSEPTEAPTTPAVAQKIAENRAILPPPGENPGGTPTRSETQCNQGDQGRMTMRIVALDLGVKNSSYCEVFQGQVVHRATVSELESLRSLLGPVSGQCCRKAAVTALPHDQGERLQLPALSGCRRHGQRQATYRRHLFRG